MIKVKSDKELKKEKDQLTEILKENDFEICIHIPIFKIKELGFLLRDLEDIDNQKDLYEIKK